MKLTDSQRLFIEVGRIEGDIKQILCKMGELEVEGYDLEGSELEAHYNEKIKELQKKRRYRLRKARTAYNKEIKHENTANKIT